MNYLTAFEFHGFGSNSETNEEALGDCVFCGKEDHFYLNLESGLWKCHRCQEGGNLETFLYKVHEQCLQETTKADRQKLGKDRGVSSGAIKRHFLAIRPDGNWLIPYYDLNCRLINLKVYTGEKLLNTTGIKTELYTPFGIQPKVPILVCEGEWDAIALEMILKKQKKLDQYSIVAVPGAGSFKSRWSEVFQERDVILLLDNDESGTKGMDLLLKKCTTFPDSIKSIKWPNDYPSKYDIRDLVISKKGKEEEVLEFIEANLQDRTSELLPSRTEFQEVITDFKKTLYVSKTFENAILISLSTVVSCRIPGDPLWMFLVGPPGSGKTTLLESFHKTKLCELVSKFTAKSLISGFKTTDGEDPSLLPRLKDRTLVIKDYTAIKSMPIQTQEELYGILRDAYDGFVKIPYGNKEIRSYNDVYFSLLAGVTDVIYGDNRASLGERFLKCDILDETDDSERLVQAAVNKSFKDLKTTKQFLRLSVRSFLDEFKEIPSLPELSSDLKERIVAFAQIIAILRSQVPRVKGEVSYTPRPEIGTRIATQLCKLALSVSLVLKEPAVTERVYDLLLKVGLDSSKGQYFNIVKLLVRSSKGLSASDLSSAIGLPSLIIKKKLQDLQLLGAMTYDPAKKKYKLKPEVVNNWKLSQIKV